MPLRWWFHRAFDVPCTIEIEQTADFFHAHLVLDGDVDIQPGDQIRVHGDPVRVTFGQSISERRQATVSRATWLARAWTRIAAGFELMELYEVSFTTRRAL
jgi:hypothetical protein